MKLRQLTLALSFVGASTVGLVGCGGSSNDYPEIVSLEGTAIDGYLANAKVCVDSNRNRQCDQGEDFAMTDGNGDFELQTSDDDSPLVLESTASTVDITSEEPVGEGLFLTAPNGSANITPLTTLAQIRSEVTGESYADSQAAVISDLGISGVSNLAAYDYIAAQNSADTATARNARKAAGTASAVARIIIANNNALAASSVGRSAVRSAVVFSLLVSSGGNTPLRNITAAVNAAVDADMDPDLDTIVDDNTPDPDDVEDLSETIEDAEGSGGNVDTSGSSGGGSV